MSLREQKQDRKPRELRSASAAGTVPGYESRLAGADDKVGQLLMSLAARISGLPIRQFLFSNTPASRAAEDSESARRRTSRDAVRVGWACV